MTTELETRLSLVFDFDQYAGNFERSLFSFLSGRPLHPEAGLHPYFATPFVPYAKITGEQFEKLFEIRSNHRGWQQYGDICPTPGYWNDGNGNHFPDSVPAKEGQRKYSAYQSVMLFLQKGAPHPDLLSLMEEAKLFPAAYEKSKCGSPLALLGVRLVRDITTRFESYLWEQKDGK